MFYFCILNKYLSFCFFFPYFEIRNLTVITNEHLEGQSEVNKSQNNKMLGKKSSFTEVFDRLRTVIMQQYRYLIVGTLLSIYLAKSSKTV